MPPTLMTLRYISHPRSARNIWYTDIINKREFETCEPTREWLIFWEKIKHNIKIVVETSDDNTYIYSVSEERVRSISVRKTFQAQVYHKIKIVVEDSSGDMNTNFLSVRKDTSLSVRMIPVQVGNDPRKKWSKSHPVQLTEGRRNISIRGLHSCRKAPRRKLSVAGKILARSHL